MFARRIVSAIVALLLALGCAQPALAQDSKPTAGAAATPRVPEPYDTWQPTAPFYCSQADKDAAIKLLERQLEIVNSRADSARAYMQEMRERIDKDFRDKEEVKYNNDRAALSTFESHYRDRIIVEDPQRAEDDLAKARAAPIKDCTKRESFTPYRPAIAPFPDVKFPPCIRTPADEAAIERDLARLREGYDELARRVQDYRKAVFAMARSKDAAIAKAAKDEIDSAEFRALDRDLAEWNKKMNHAHFDAQLIKACPADTGKPATPPSGTPVPPNCKPVSHESDNSLTQFALQTLEAHNAERAAVGAAPLRWNFMLADSATQWARQLAMIGRLEHSPREGRSTVRENLQQGLPGWDTRRMLQDWIGEKRLFMPGTFPDVAYKGDVNQVLHYTQIIWPTTTDLGCGIAPGGGYQWEVCEYSPGGNRDGVAVGVPVRCPPPPPPPPPPSISPGPFIIFFDFNNADITPQAAALLDRALEAFRQSGSAQVVLASAADQSGSDAYNAGLMRQREENVKGYLAAQGMPANGMVSSSFGEGQTPGISITLGPGPGR